MFIRHFLCTRIMKPLYVCACFFSFLTILYASVPAKSGCVEREKALAFLETAEDFLSKAEDAYPSCKDDSNSTDESECSGKKSLAYIEISKKLISDARESFPSCIGSKVIVPCIMYRDCSEILASGRNKSGVYTIWLTEANANGSQVQVYCDMEIDGGGWTLIQRRGKYIDQQNFFLDWQSYKKGFGNLTQEFWLGNENIRILCLYGCKIRFDLQAENGEKRFAVYKKFYLLGSQYTLNIGSYTGNAGDSMRYHNNYAFSTKDSGKTEYIQRDKSGWWSGPMYHSNLNGIYQPGGDSTQSVYWYEWLKYKNLAAVEIKVRPE